MCTKIKLLILAMGFLLIACKSDNGDIQEAIKVYPAQEIVMLSDSTFFGDIADMIHTDNSIYIVDNTPRIFQLDSDFKIKHRLSDTGKGPGEFTGIWKMETANDSIYAYNKSLGKIIVYDSLNNFQREVKVPNTLSFVVDSSSNIYFSTPAQNKLITVINANSNIINAFEDPTVDKESFNIHRNRRFLVILQDKLISIPEAEKVIKVFNLSGELLSETPVAHPLIEKYVDRVSDDFTIQYPEDFKPSLWYDAAGYKDKIYLLANMKRDENREPKYSLSFSYKLDSKGKLTFDHVFKLFPEDEESRLTGFRILPFGDSKLMVYDLHNKSLLVYEDERI